MAVARALNLAATNDRHAADTEVKMQEALLIALPPLLSWLLDLRRPVEAS